MGGKIRIGSLEPCSVNAALKSCCSVMCCIGRNQANSIFSYDQIAAILCLFLIGAEASEPVGVLHRQPAERPSAARCAAPVQHHILRPPLHQRQRADRRAAQLWHAASETYTTQHTFTVLRSISNLTGLVNNTGFSSVFIAVVQVTTFFFRSTVVCTALYI